MMQVVLSIGKDTRKEAYINRKIVNDLYIRNLVVIPNNFWVKRDLFLQSLIIYIKTLKLNTKV